MYIYQIISNLYILKKLPIFRFVTNMRKFLSISTSLLLLISCVSKKNYTNDLVTPINVDIVLPGQEYSLDVTTLELDSNLYNQYQISYKDGNYQTISIGEKLDLKDFLYSNEVDKIDTLKSGVLWKDLFE